MEREITPEPPRDPPARARRQRGRRAEDEALARLVAEHGDAVWRLARSVVRDSSLADDVVQETMVKAWRAMSDPEGPQFDGGTVPRPWLMKVARNTAISLLRTRRDDPVEPDDLVEVAAPGSGTGVVATDRVAMEHMWDALAGLDETSRSVVVMRELSGMSYEEIADVLDIPLPTVKTRLFRARRVLQTSMKEWRP
jgi:RNA polymerase sigma-70 factor (ECF subfamily)